jgi:hypothetical protein
LLSLFFLVFAFRVLCALRVLRLSHSSLWQRDDLGVWERRA